MTPTSSVARPTHGPCAPCPAVPREEAQAITAWRVSRARNGASWRVRQVRTLVLAYEPTRTAPVA